MNLKNWNIEHTKGMLFGALTPLIFIPIVIFFISWMQSYTFERLWNEFTHFDEYRIKIITISIIANLFWFYRGLNKENYNFSMGVIMGSIIYTPYILYIKFL